MKNFPMFLRMDGRRVVICGGGVEAARKLRLILKTDADITIAARDLDPEMEGIVASGRAHHQSVATPCTFIGAGLVFIATGDEAEENRIAGMARAAGAVVNVVDRPDMCDAVTPSIVDRDPVVVAIGTEGAAPVLGRRIKTEVETMLSPRLGGFAALAGRLRDSVAARVKPADRRSFWEWAFSGPAYQAHVDGREHAAAEILKSAISAGSAPKAEGHIALVGAGPGARDLLTLRAVQRLQQADVVYYDRLVDPEVLELARRDCDRVFVGKEVGAHSWPQDKIDRIIVASAQQGLRVVRLKSGDPSVFGRATEELQAARAAGIEVEIVPGITAASAAAASISAPLTVRGETDTLILSTGTTRPGDDAPDHRNLARPGTTMAFYMAVERAARVQADLLAAGTPADCPVDIVAHASTAREQHVETTLSDLAEAVARNEIHSPAILFVRYPKHLAPARALPVSA